MLFLALVGFMSGMCYYFVKDNSDKMNYIFPDEDPNPSIYGVRAIGSFFIMLNSFIPLALIVVLEFGKLFYTGFIESDAEMA